MYRTVYICIIYVDIDINVFVLFHAIVHWNFKFYGNIIY